MNHTVYSYIVQLIERNEGLDIVLIFIRMTSVEAFQI